MSPLDHKLLPVFLEEALENLSAIESALEAPTDREALERGFRAAHTIKGTSALVKLAAPSTVARRLEDAFEALMESGTAPAPAESEALRYAGSVLREMVEGAQAGVEPATVAAEEADRRLQDAAAAVPASSLRIAPQEPAPQEPVAEQPSLLLGAGFACCRFRVAGRPFFLAIAEMVEISECPPLIPLPLAPSHLPGLVNLRGSVLPVIDLAPLKGEPPTEASGAYLVVAGASGERAAFLSEELPSLALEGEGEGIDLAAFIARHRVGAA